MTHSSNYLARLRLTLRVAFAALACFASGLAADEPDERLAAHLASGEFAPALARAHALEDTALRDQWLGRIATAQAEVGARRASMDTLLDVQSDLARSRIVNELGERPMGAGGGAAMADFDTLINLVTSTIAPDTWDEVGGAGAIEPFPTGVYVDTSGVMKRLPPARDTGLLREAREEALADSGNRDVRRSSDLRKVSLVRLERHIQLWEAFGKAPDDAMRSLAGMYRIRYLLVYPETGDIVLAGPAGDWRTDREGRVVNEATGAPVLQLDDFVVALRNAYGEHGRMGCAIKPRQANLAAAKAYVESSGGQAIRPGARDRWVAGLRDALGKQDIEVWGIDARTGAARVLVEADYHMKLIGMGLEEGTLGVQSYLELLKDSGTVPETMSVLRWWFTLNYDGVRTNSQRNVYQLDGPGVQVLSENEMLTERGERIHTGKSSLLNLQFARSFTRHIDALANKYPVYAELRNVFDLALVSGILRSEDLPSQVNWHMTHFGRDGAYRPLLGPAAREVESIVNSIDVNRQQFLVGVSGGVSIDTQSLVDREAIEVDDYGRMDAARAAATADLAQLPRDVWWWD